MDKTIVPTKNPTGDNESHTKPEIGKNLEKPIFVFFTGFIPVQKN
jgi:hypothetical protein